MLFRTLLRDRKRPFRHRPRRPSRSRLLLEWLEPRNLLSVVNVNTDSEGRAQNETTLAVNPTNPLNLIGSANDYATGDTLGNIHVPIGFVHAHVTFDGGQTWTEYPIPFDQQYSGTVDPAVAYDADGTAYLATLAYKVQQNGEDQAPDLVVARSTDRGKSWSQPVRVTAGSGQYLGAGTTLDKDYLAAWGHGNAIVTWTQFDLGAGGRFTISAPIFASVTHDGGQTWTAPVAISGSFVNDQGSVPVVAADGSIHVVFVSFNQEVAPEYRSHFKVVKVDPATGQALGVPAEVALVYDGAHDTPFSVDGYATLQDSEFRTANVLPNDITADPTNPLHLAVVWSDTRNNPYPGGLLPSSDPYQVKTNSDIIISQSFDGGLTWSVPSAIQEPNDQFEPWGEYDANGRLQIGYYDRSYDPANHMYGYTLASETSPGSLNFTLQQVTTALSDPTQGDAWFTVTANSKFPNATRFMGDYSNIAITPNGVASLWTDMRLQSTVPGSPGSSEDAFFALVDPPLASAALVVPASAGIPPEGATTKRAAVPVFHVSHLGSVNFLGASVSSATTLVVPASAGIAPQDGTTSLAGIWSIDPSIADRQVANLSQSQVLLALARAGMRNSGLTDDAWSDTFGITDFATEGLL